MKPIEEFYFGVGLIIASVILLVCWVASEILFKTAANLGAFSGVVAMGLFYIYRAITKGYNNEDNV